MLYGPTLLKLQILKPIDAHHPMMEEGQVQPSMKGKSQVKSV